MKVSIKKGFSKYIPLNIFIIYAKYQNYKMHHLTLRVWILTVDN